MLLQVNHMKWYEQNYVSHRDWILDHLRILNLTPQEFMLVMTVDFMNEHRMPITMETLSRQTGISQQECDRVISVLCAKQYLQIRACNQDVRFVLDGLFETETARTERVMDQSLYDLFETEFSRPLNPREMEKISEWNSIYGKKMIVQALREASAYRHLNTAYIDRILQEWKKNGANAGKDPV